ncbi:tryptophanyl-tRNA synthetase-like protein [Myriangium duriaei CBS 260.36]|uniref:tryptophan--tRNA ligase n=1 Tax=Myriangium duriaei CBS 260.36 TaxID=1168546 RepID=A0A9P4IWX7_9PEZI|nr:tryptophanyl-tRNA synthetase-like protein [Myriangium duriaei CBS 260.36]
MATEGGKPHTAEAVSAPPAVELVQQAAAEQKIDPYTVSGARDAEGNIKAIDYEALRQRFNTPALTDEHLKRFEQVTGKKPHRLMRRRLFFSHRDFDKILDAYEKYGFFLLYTGRGPSSGSMHLGHAVPFLFTKELQDLFDVPLVIMLTDDEKFLYTRNKNEGKPTPGAALGDFIGYAFENAKDIISIGFDRKKTFIYTDYSHMGGHFYQNISEFEALLTNNQIRGALGFDGSTNVGLNAYAAKQCVAAFASSYPELFGYGDFRPGNWAERRPRKNVAAIPTLIPCAIDQEPWFRILRENCDRMEFPSPKTALILSKFLTALQGPGGKMSASDANSAIFMSDTPKQIEKKINRSFSGGGATKEDHEKYGGNPDVDVAYAYLSYFLESDEELSEIEEGYRKGTLSTGELKKKCISELQKFVGDFQERRSRVTDQVLEDYMTFRKLEYKGNPTPTVPGGIEAFGTSGKKPSGDAGEKVISGRGTTKKERKEAKNAEKKAEKLALREKKEEEVDKQEGAAAASS